MAAAFGDTPFIEHDDLVGMGDRRQPVRDDQRRASLRYLRQRRLDFVLGAAVQRRGGLVQDQDRRIFQQGAGNCHPLLLAAGQFQAAFADLRVIAVRQLGDKAVERRAARRLLDLRLGRALAAIADIVADAVVEQDAVLRHDADRPAQAVLGDFGYVLAVDQDAARLRIVEAEQQPRDRRLAGPRRPDNRQRPVCRHLEIQPVQNLAVPVIVEHHILEPHHAIGNRQGLRSRLVDNLLFGVDQLEHRVHVDQPLADRAIDHAEHVERPEQLHQQRVDQHQVTDRQVALLPAIDAERHRPDHRQVGDDRLADIEQAERIFRLDCGIGPVAHRLVIALALAPLGGEIFDRFVVQQRVDRPADHPCVHVVHPRPERIAPVGHLTGEQDIDRDHRRGRHDQAKAELDLEDDQHRRQLDHRRRNIEQQEIEHHVDALGAALDDLGHLAGAATQMEAQRQAVQMGKDIGRETAGGLLADLLEHDIAQIIEHHLSEPRQPVSRHQRQQYRQLGAECIVRHAVDHRLVEKRHRQDRRLGA